MANPLALGAAAAIALAVLATNAPPAAADAGAETGDYQIFGRVRVISGSILIVGRQEVHLWAIEAAALHQPCTPRKSLTCGEFARITLQQIATGHRVWCQLKERPEDALHVVARCETRNNGQKLDLGQEMVRLGYAYAGSIGDKQATGPYAKFEHRTLSFRRPWIWRQHYAGNAAGRYSKH